MYKIDIGGLRKVLEERLEVAIEEVEIMMRIRPVYQYLSRNKNNEIIATVNKPVKDIDGGCWKDPEGRRHYTLYEKEMKYFPYIKWENEEPISINRLLGGNYKIGEIR